MNNIRSTKLTYSRVIEFIGLDRKSRKIILIPDVLGFRKGMAKISTRAAQRGYKEFVGIMSSPSVLNGKNTKYCKFWCHCLRDFPIKKPNMLLSESDFLDPQGIHIVKRANTKWDFYYFTAGGKTGVRNKGSHVFANNLHMLCGEFGLRGVVIKYIKSKRPFMADDSKIIRKYRKFLTIKGRVDALGVAKIMSKCKFGFFPNIRDCSPLLMSESLIRDCPVLVNHDIWGGWKYVNEDTGACFRQDDPDDLCSQLKFILSNDFNPRERHLSLYGYKKSAVRLAQEGKKYVKSFRRFSMVGFKGSYGMMDMFNE